MKKINIEKKILDCLKFCVSKDETRPQLSGFYYCPNNESVVTTNGHVLFMSKYFYNQNLKGMIVSPENLLTIDREFVRYEAVLPKIEKCKKGIIKLEKFHAQKGSEKITKLFFHKKSSGEFYISFEKNEGEFIGAFDNKLLKPLCDGSVYEFFYSGELNPFRFNIQENNENNFMIVMPIKS